jgi:hypothetical protein
MQSLMHEYGAEAQAVIDRVRASAHDVSRPESGREDAEAGDRTAESARSDGAPDARGPEDGKTPLGETARIRRNLSDDEPARSLFDAAEPAAVEQIEKAVAGYKDTLTGERLTARLNAPLTREEQLKKLKRSQEKARPLNATFP